MTPAGVFVRRLGRYGQPQNGRGWRITAPGENAFFARLQVNYNPRANDYRVAWLSMARTRSVIATRTISADGARASPLTVVAEPGVFENPQFDFGTDPATGASLAVWVSALDQRRVHLLAQRVSPSGHRIGQTTIVSTDVDPPAINNHRPQVIPIGDGYVITWRNETTLRVENLPLHGQIARSATVPLPDDPTRAITTAVDSATGTLLILSTDDNRGGPNQVFARALPLPR